MCAYGRAATAYPTSALRGVLPHEYCDLVRVGAIEWPNAITWDSLASAQIFQDYADQNGRAHKAGASGGVGRLEVFQIDLTTVIGYHEDPRTREEWRWIEAHAEFESVRNGVDAGTFDFMVPVNAGGDTEAYESAPPSES